MMNNELLKLAEFLNSELLWLYFVIVFILFYAIISLLTWDIKKPLMFLGIPSIIVGTFLIILRFLVSLFVPNESLLNLFNSSIKPLFIIGIICIIVGIIMIIVYKVLNKIKKNKQIIQKNEV